MLCMLTLFQEKNGWPAAGTVQLWANGSGALTRICEMLCAGVPVLANTYTALSYYNMKG